MSYSISVDPEVAVNFTGRNSSQLTVSYDIKYNISVVASLCEIITANHFIIHHGKPNTCRLSRLTTINFIHAVTCPSINNSPIPALVGGVVPINCPSGTVLTGPN